MSNENSPVDLNGVGDKVDAVFDEVLGAEPKADPKPAEPVEKSEPKPVKEYVPPASQEALDKIINSRLDRATSKYKDYDDIKKQLDDLLSEKEKAETAKLDDVEKERRRAEQAEKRAAELEAAAAKRDRADLVRDIGDELGLPPKLRGRVQGETDEEIRADIAELLEGLPQADKSAPPGPPASAPKEKVKLSANGIEPPEVTSDDILDAVGRGGLHF
ncbi:DUF4355 domain-containing protein [Mycobacteroides abscessus]|uniref:DUF4355 domain-containing protein n=1 Tax=Mycobacteroides abscessus TaxID=36809 RepID=UPI000D3E5C4B|nr:DUF4355 domain-containing protein [Mycobacteroides abscessus]PVB19740.1 hypothetical protein DDJ40_08250 [Mycobacteroides abscessus]RIU40343.1 DUF4355 domain-containing protein [Mycobacteroides abscessus]